MCFLANLVRHVRKQWHVKVANENPTRKHQKAICLCFTSLVWTLGGDRTVSHSLWQDVTWNLHREFQSTKPLQPPDLPKSAFHFHTDFRRGFLHSKVEHSPELDILHYWITEFLSTWVYNYFFALCKVKVCLFSSVFIEHILTDVKVHFIIAMCFTIHSGPDHNKQHHQNNLFLLVFNFQPHWYVTYLLLATDTVFHSLESL